MKQAKAQAGGRAILMLYPVSAGLYRGMIKTNHGRLIFIKLRLERGICQITDCFYADRNRRGTGAAAPKRLTTRSCAKQELVQVIAKELDRQYESIRFSGAQASATCTDDTFIAAYKQQNEGNRMLLLIGHGAQGQDTLFDRMETCFQNRSCRSIHLQVRRRADGRGEIECCRYCDARSKRYRTPGREQTASGLYSYLFSYTKAEILRIVNEELNADFTAVLVVDDSQLQIAQQPKPICGYRIRQ